MMDAAAALVKVKTLCPMDNDPVLTEGELTAVVADSIRFSVWAAATVYGYGVKVIPPVANGRLYKAVYAGTSGAASPFILLNFSPYSPHVLVLGDTFSEGGSGPQWLDIGPAFSEQYDVRAAASKAWALKAAKAAGRIDFSDSEQRFTASQTEKSCLAMARQYAPLRMG